MVFRFIFLSHKPFHWCSIPFSVDDISKSIQRIQVADVEPPPFIRENSRFGFLLSRSESFK
ncbi:hypothetical protein Lalb_Chr11g0074381 [Lupinus albus]|uniref:Uncharacterized protein n=1 Tax=Lupinus albus TaxID=3870 RepID=A0A6A4PT69_LUPAL|nr:hypothetical protein Lalb_Chr11g0074381 [Lupinus albus]